MKDYTVQVTDLSKRSVAANIGKAAFLLPEIEISPLTLQGPLIKNFCMLNFWKCYALLPHILAISI